MTPRLLLSLLCSLLLAPLAWSAPVTFAWDPSPVADYLLRGYTFTLTTNTGAWSTNFILAGRTNNTFILSNQVPAGAWRATVRAVDTNGIASDPSNAIEFALPPPPVLRIQASVLGADDPAGPWTPMATLPPLSLAAHEARRFFQIRANITRE